MKPWGDLTEAGQMRRLRPLARSAFGRYPLDIRRLRLVGGFENVVFRVDGSDGSFAVRVDLHQSHADTDVDIEVAWLEALARDTDLDVSRVIRSVAGEPYVYEEAAGVPGARRCTVFGWMPGAPIAERMTPARYFNLGVLAARLQAHGAGFRPPATPMKWNRIFYWAEDIVVYDRFAQGTKQRAIFDAAAELVESAFDRLPAEGAQIVHGDLHPWNVHGVRDRVYALDFEDVMWAHPVQDVAISLYYEQDHPAYGDLREAFVEGFSSVALWPERYDGEIAHFETARRLMFVNYVLRTGFADDAWVARAMENVERFVASHG